MNIKKGLPGSIALLALLISGGVQATAERPQLKNFDSYTDFLRAVVAYTRGDDPSSLGERACSDDEVGPDGAPIDKQNPCSPTPATENTPLADDSSADSAQDGIAMDDVGSLDDLDSLDSLDTLDNPDGSSASNNPVTMEENTTPAPASSTPSGDTLEQAIALARDGLNPTYIDPESNRTTFRSFPMQPVESDDLAAVTFIDALTGLLVDTRNSQVRLNIDPNSMTNSLAQSDDRVSADGLSFNLNNIEFQQLLLSNVAPFFGGDFVWTTEGNYYAIVNASPYFIDDNGVALEFSTQARVRAAIVDSDGWISGANPNAPTAGAFVIDPLNITTGTISARLWAIQDANGNSSVRSLLDAPDDIVVDLSNTTLGVATATRNETSWDIGPVSTFMAFGDNSALNISLDGPLETILSNPDDSTNTPLIRINGKISSMTLTNIALLDGSSNHGIHYGRVTVNNLDIVDQSIFFENNGIRIDMGKGAENLHVSFERVVIGGTMQDRANGTLPAAAYDREMYIKMPDNMQVTLTAH